MLLDVHPRIRDHLQGVPLDVAAEFVDVIARDAQLTCGQASHNVEGVLRLARALDDEGLDACNDFAGRVEALMRDLIEDRVVALVADAGQCGKWSGRG